MVRVTQKELPPDGATHWSTRSLAKRFGVGKDTVARIWQDNELKPWKLDRNGTVDLFAALNINTGEVITDCRQRHTSADVLAFFKHVDRSVPRGLSVHVVLDNLSAHMGPEVENWLAQKKQARWHLHFVPTSSSWLNLVEGGSRT